MVDEEIERVRERRRDGDVDGYLAAALELAGRRPTEVRVRIEAAYASDRYGSEEEAIRHYDAAWDLGVPEGEERSFLVGYGSTLRNVGRTDEAVTRLGEAIERFPDYPALKAFLALALQSAGHGDAAVATLLEVVLDLSAGSSALDGYERALSHYRDELLERAMRA